MQKFTFYVRAVIGVALIAIGSYGLVYTVLEGIHHSGNDDEKETAKLVFYAQLFFLFISIIAGIVILIVNEKPKE